MKYLNRDNYNSIIILLTTRAKRGDEQACADLDTLTNDLVRCVNLVSCLSIFALSDICRKKLDDIRAMTRDGRSIERAAECAIEINQIADEYDVGPIFINDPGRYMQAVTGFCLSLTMVLYSREIRQIESWINQRGNNS